MLLVNPTGVSELHLLPNRPEVELFSNIASNSRRGWPEITRALDPIETPAVLVGGGPSLEATLETVRMMKERGAKIFGLNQAARYLAEHGIKPDYQVMIDSRIENVQFVQERWADQVLLATQVHPKVIETCFAIGYPILLWQPAVPDIDKHTGREKPFAIWSGWTVGLTALCVAHTLGHRELHLFGYDSCHSEKKSHVYDQTINADDEMTEVAVDGRVFSCSVTMAAQAFHFQEVAEMLAEHGATLSVHGEGLIQHIAKRMTTETKALTAIYDLGVSPPTYDFLPFLSEAEKARKDGGYSCLDIIFQPGPIGGFRNDKLPPSIPERESMLHRVCVSACRLLPSVRNVAVLKNRMNIPGDLFPAGWSPSTPKSHYGVQYLKDGHRCLTASHSAKDEISRRFPERYVTVTLRQSDYWPERNSDLKAWMAAASYLYQHLELRVIFIPDTHGQAPLGVKTFEPAAWDIDIRMALYEGAVVNLGVANGPLALCMLSEAKYIMWKPIDPSGKAPAHSADFYGRHGINAGDQFGPNGKIVWETDSSANIIRALREWFYGPETEEELLMLANSR